MKIILVLLVVYSCTLAILIKDDYNGNDFGKITEGEEAELGQFPWQVAVLLDNEFICGGALINYLFVITSAECISQHRFTNISVLVGSLTYDIEPAQGKYNIKSTILHKHPKYNETHFKDYNNIGLIALSYPVPDHDHIGFINLPDDDEAVEIGQIVTLSGWGGSKDDQPSETLQYADMKLMSLSDCSDYQGGELTNNTFCTQAYPSNSACLLDHGSAMMRFNGTRVPFHIGVVSSSGCQDTNKRTVYTDIAAHRQWIRNMVGI